MVISETLHNGRLTIMDRTKKMTLKHWASLSEGSRRRALTCVFPLQRATVDMLMNEKPDPKNNGLWKFVWCKVRIPLDSYCKTVVNHTYIL